VPLDRQPILVGAHIELRPLQADDFDELYAIASDPLLWEQHPAKERAQEPVFRQWMAEAMESGGALVATDQASGRIVGTSRYDFHGGEVEIGWTFIDRRLWGTGLNDEMKQLMLRHAFACVDAVVFRVHCENFRSQRAVEKLGAMRVGSTFVAPYGEHFVFRLLNPQAIERDLAIYYDAEVDDRAGRELQPPRHAARDAFITSLEAPTTVLEIGVGVGRDAVGFVAAGHAVVGTDLSAAFARRSAHVGASTVVASVRALPFQTASFDALWTMSTLMHVPDSAIGSALVELRRVLRPGGTAGIGVWGGDDVEDFLESREYGPPRLFSRRSDARWRDMLTTVGVVEHFERWDDAGDPFWYQYAIVRRG